MGRDAGVAGVGQDPESCQDGKAFPQIREQTHHQCLDVRNRGAVLGEKGSGMLQNQLE